MGHIVNAIAYRLGYSRTWNASWAAEKKLYLTYLQEDFIIFRFVKLFLTEYTIPETFIFPHSTIEIDPEDERPTDTVEPQTVKISGLDRTIFNPFAQENLLFSHLNILRQKALTLNIYLLDPFRYIHKPITDLDLFKVYRGVENKDSSIVNTVNIAGFLEIDLVSTVINWSLFKALLLTWGFVTYGAKQCLLWVTLLRSWLTLIISIDPSNTNITHLKVLNLLFIKEFSFRHHNLLYCKELFFERFFIYKAASTAISASLDAFDKNTHRTINFLGMDVKNINANLAVGFIITKLAGYYPILEILSPLLQTLRTSSVLKGFRVIVAGRLTRKERAAYMVKQDGHITLATKSCLIDYAADFKIMRFGVVGVKIWLYHSKYMPTSYIFKWNMRSTVNQG